MPTLLLTGATGFIGSHFLRAYHRSYRCVALVRPSSETQEIAPYCELALYNGGYEELEEAFSRYEIDGVLHLAACVQGGRASLDSIPDVIAANITLGTQICELLRLYPARFFINTLSYFQFAKNARYHPHNLYAATKQGFYDICVYYARVLPTYFSHLLPITKLPNYMPTISIDSGLKRLLQAPQIQQSLQTPQVPQTSQTKDLQPQNPHGHRKESQ